MVEVYKIPQGKLVVSYCDKNLSIGLLELNANQELSKHSRPVDEELFQVYGTSIVKLDKEVTLNEGDTIKIAANEEHVHSNPSDKKSITLWKFEGDIVEIINKFRRG